MRNPNPETIAKAFGCTVEQVKKQFGSNALSLRALAVKAKTKGRKVNGYTASELEAMSAQAAQKAS